MPERAGVMRCARILPRSLRAAAAPCCHLVATQLPQGGAPPHHHFEGQRLVEHPINFGHHLGLQGRTTERIGGQGWGGGTWQRRKCRLGPLGAGMQAPGRQANQGQARGCAWRRAVDVRSGPCSHPSPQSVPRPLAMCVNLRVAGARRRRSVAPLLPAAYRSSRCTVMAWLERAPASRGPAGKASWSVCSKKR